ncbi:MAG: hypothetical protein KIT58_17475 [Planctomycetota bacterium]|nr:hypothetical protein [Planctomycetota bacterium]
MPRTFRGLAVGFVCVALSACAGPEAMPLEPPLRDANPRPALAIAPLVRLDRASVDRPTWPPSGGQVWAGDANRIRAQQTPLECQACGEEVPSPPLVIRRADDEVAPAASPTCPDCGGTTFYLEPFSTPYRPATDLAATRARAGALLAERGVFERVHLLPADDPTLDPVLGVTPEVRHVWRETARARGARWLLEPVLEEARVELIEKNGLHALKVVNLILSSIFIFPGVDPLNWFIPGEDYGVVQRLAWRVTDLDDGPGGEGLRELVTRASFADIGPGPTRGFFIVGFLRAPGCLDEEDWTHVAGQLTEVAAEDLARALVGAAEGAGR